MCDSREDTEDSCGEEEVEAEWEVTESWLISMLQEYHDGNLMPGEKVSESIDISYPPS